MATTEYGVDCVPDSRPGFIHYVDERGKPRRVDLSKNVFTIGRTRDNDLAISHHLISRYHAEVIFDGREYTYIDKRSRRGSFIECRRISEKLLSDGDTIRLGSSECGPQLTFYFPRFTRLQPPEVASESAQTANGLIKGTPPVSLATLNRINRQLAQCTHRMAIAEKLLAALEQLFPLAELAIFFYHPENQALRIESQRRQRKRSRLAETSGWVVTQVFSRNLALKGYDSERHEFFLSVPLASARRVWGVCYLTSQEHPFKSEEEELLYAVGQQAGLALETLHLDQQRQRTCESLIRALALSIDARDQMTAGHSARVAGYAAAIARYLGLPPQQQRVVYYAALLHDYGKIGISDEVLCKAAPLTPEEYEKIKQHPLYTLNLLSKIHFTEELAEVPLIASSHHERPDGLGYPHGLRRAEIPIGSLIIAVADFFDALTVKRHYRDPMPQEEVLELIAAGRDTHFDGAVIDAFFRYYREEYLPRQRRRSERNNRPQTSELGLWRE
jgi:HD-GYP domain-containing protein (c-di-GMP phosphodiesterase class II)